MTFDQLQFDTLADQIWYYSQAFLTFFLVIYLILMYRAMKKSTIASQRDIYKGFALFVVSILLGQILFMLRVTYSNITGNDLYPRLIRIGGTGFEYLLILCFCLGFIFLMAPIEKYIQNKEKFTIAILSKIALILLLVPYIGAIIYPNEFWTFVAYPGVFVFAIAAIFSIFGSFLFYLQSGLRSSGSIRKKGFLIGFGILMMYIGLLTASLGLPDELEWLTVFFGPVLMIVGSIMVIIGHGIEI